ncbi:MAG: hypothetical protein GY747_00845 [Planctomycetes bacterium]|nr:hypothetical protein [Planctomycetota bacterium]MCP4769774.1 hypothetical protein [Planctomycetota bacterium]
MNRSLRVAGLAGAAVILGLVGLDMFQHARAVALVSETAELSPEGFSQNMSGVGKVYTAFRGPISILAEKRVPQLTGTTVYVPRFHVNGVDPSPLADGVSMTDTRIDSLEAEPGKPVRTAFTVVSPKAWMPLDEKADRFTFSMEKLWQLEQPVLTMPDFTEGRALVLETAHADLDPETDQVFGRGPFTMTSGNLRLEGADLFFDPNVSRVEFQPLDGVLSWKIRGEDGVVYRGECDGPGAFFPGEDGGYRLELYAIDQVQSWFPAESIMPGTLLTKDLTLELLPNEEGSWRPHRATADGPTDWTGDTLHMLGTSSIVAWDETGNLQNLTVLGPVTVEPHDRSFEWASADGFGRYAPSTDSVRLEDKVVAKHERGTLKGDWAELAPEKWLVGGSVTAVGVDGSGISDLLESDRQGNWWLTGNAELRPHETDVEWLRSPAIHFTEDGLVETDATFQAKANIDSKPLLARGNSFESKMEAGATSLQPDVRRTTADGNLEVIYEGRTLMGEHLLQTGDKSFQMTGDPAKGKRVTGTYQLDEHTAELDCGLLVWDGVQVEVLQAPMVSLPAAALHLSGDRVLVYADQIRQDAASGTWELVDNVRLGGAMKGEGARAILVPNDRLELQAGDRFRGGKNETAWLEGTLENGAAFRGRGEVLRYHSDGRMAIERQAFASYQGKDKEAPAELYGARLEFSENSGWAEGEARFLSNELTGSADRVDWTRVDLAQHVLVLVGNALLQHDAVEARGPRIEMDTRASTITSIGAKDSPARLRAADGRRMVGDWLRYNLDSGLFDSRGAEFETD